MHVKYAEAQIHQAQQRWVNRRASSNRIADTEPEQHLHKYETDGGRGRPECATVMLEVEHSGEVDPRPS